MAESGKPTVSRSASGFDLTPWTPNQREAAAKDLTAEERQVILYQGTEPPFCGGFLNNKHDGVYECRLCKLPLFRSVAKFESGTGWPSFYEPFDKDHIAYLPDHSHGRTRTEIRCARCDGHLGHVFEDGPRPTGLRYCLNSASLQFEEGKKTSGS
jgi:peptide-methionine (R)-S-oxide reductase